MTRKPNPTRLSDRPVETLRPLRETWPVGLRDRWGVLMLLGGLALHPIAVFGMATSTWRFVGMCAGLAGAFLVGFGASALARSRIPLVLIFTQFPLLITGSTVFAIHWLPAHGHVATGIVLDEHCRRVKSSDECDYDVRLDSGRTFRFSPDTPPHHLIGDDIKLYVDPNGWFAPRETSDVDDYADDTAVYAWSAAMTLLLGLLLSLLRLRQRR